MKHLPGRPSAPRTNSARRLMANGGPVPAWSVLARHASEPFHPRNRRTSHNARLKSRLSSRHVTTGK
jgi:hypothetical protein